MKKWVVGLVVIGMMVVPAFAHPGGTDGSGGHYNRSTGEYHYHHGHSAHDHVDGVCPYDYDDKTGERSGSGGGSGGTAKNHNQTTLTVYQTLQKGDHGNDVADLQRRLNRLGYSAGEVDGIFGSRTEAAVKQFQKNNGINVTGKVSYATLSKLFPELVPVVATKPTTKPTTEPADRNKSTVAQTKSISAGADRVKKVMQSVLTIFFLAVAGVPYLIVCFNAFVILPIRELLRWVRDDVALPMTGKFSAWRRFRPYKWLIKSHPDFKVEADDKVFHISRDCCKNIPSSTGKHNVRSLSECQRERIVPCPECVTVRKLRYKVLGVIEYDFSQFTPDITKRVCVDSASPGVYHKPGGMCVPRNALGFKFVEIGQAEKKGACPCPRCLPDHYVTYKK